MKDQFCIHDVQCGGTHEKWTATPPKNTSNGDYDPTTYHHTYNSIISYDCGLGKRFNEAGTFIRNVEYICDKRASGTNDVEVNKIHVNIQRSPNNCPRQIALSSFFFFRDTGTTTQL